jgi:AraC-like DNA-binding protein
MIYQKHIPQQPLDRYVESICYIEGNNKGTGLPKIAMSLVFNLEDSFKLFTDNTFKNHIDYKRHWVAGLQTQPTNVESYGVSKMFVVQFKALGAFAFLNDPLHYYTNNYITLDDIYKNEADETWERLQYAKSRGEQFILIEDFLSRKILANRFPDQKLNKTIEVIFDKSRTPTIHHICKTLHISRKHLNYLSKEFTGVSPKTLSSLNRLQNTLKIISSYPDEKLTEIAYRLEYFDQAHFIHDFKKLTCLTPNEYASLVAKQQSMKIVPHFIPFK